MEARASNQALPRHTVAGCDCTDVYWAGFAACQLYVPVLLITKRRCGSTTTGRWRGKAPNLAAGRSRAGAPATASPAPPPARPASWAPSPPPCSTCIARDARSTHDHGVPIICVSEPLALRLKFCWQWCSSTVLWDDCRNFAACYVIPSTSTGGLRQQPASPKQLAGV